MTWSYHGGGSPAGSTNPVVDGDLTATGAFYERGRSVAMGEWANYVPGLAASSGTFSTIGIVTARYTLVGKIATVAILMTQCTISATPTSLNVTLPPGITAAQNSGTALLYRNNGTNAIGMARVNGSTIIELFKTVDGSGSFAASTTDIYEFTLSFETTT